MRASITGMTRQICHVLRKHNESGLAYSLEEMRDNLKEMSTRYQAGDTKAVDEFLELYCLKEAS